MKPIKGFTLIEILIYTLLVGLVMGSAVYVVVAGFSVRSKSQAQSNVDENMGFAMEKIAFYIHEASGINTPISGTSTSLSLNMSNAAENPTLIELSNGLIMLKVGTAASTALTSREMEFTELTIERLAATPAAVRIISSGRLRDAALSYQAPLQATTTVTIRR